MNIVCYTTEDGNRFWDCTPSGAEAAVAEVQEKYPGATIQYVLNSEASAYCGTDTNYRRQFECLASLYGVKPSDWDAEVKFPNGERGRLRGIMPNRRKYVFRVWIPLRQAHILYSKRAVLAALGRAQ